LSPMGEVKKNASPAVRLAVVSLILCGLLFPLVITGLAQVLMPGQANGSLAQYKGRPVGSELIAQSFTNASLFHPWNNSASGVDPDIAVGDALSQVPRVSNASGISAADLTTLVNAHVERTLWLWGDPYVNVLQVNLALIQTYPRYYKSFQ
jgi:potassium-transporting ATPase KdpC subunit